ncbi:MAG: M15 family metallopeptidase [Dehalococcoidia bacterium]|nr:M15 family metallopeptidase [Dehalococcoidia bacterium]
MLKVLAGAAALLLLAAVVALPGAAPRGANADHLSTPTPEPTTEPDDAGTEDQEYRLTVPGLAKERPAPLAEHTLEAGMTPFQVATLYDMNPGLLLELNGIDDPRDIPAGTRLAVVKPPPPPALLPCGDLLAPLDKEHRLAADCEPDELETLPGEYSYLEAQQLHPEAAEAFVDLVQAADAAGHLLYVRSSYRDYAEQEATFQYWVDLLGYEQARRVSAEPGHSEHQLGTAVDVTSRSVNYELDTALADTPEGQWLAERAANYGFVVSYPEGREEETGYSYEPWHLRYVGPETAADYEASGLTLNQYLAREWLPGRHLLGRPLE